MGRKRATEDPEEAQPALIPMSDEELRRAGLDLARQIQVLEQLEEEHAETKKQQKEERDKIRKGISAIASTIRQQGR
jgi:hypothetical protein